MRGWLGQLARTHAPSSVARKIAAVRTWMRWLHKRGHLASNPASELSTPKVRRPMPTFLSVDAAGEVMDAPEDDPPGLRDRALLELLYGSGLRVSEAASLDLGDVELGAARVRVVGKGNKERVVPLGGKCIDGALRAYLAMRGELPTAAEPLDPRALFLSPRGRRLGVRAIQEKVRTYGALGAGRADLHPHALRHTFATHLLDGGADPACHPGAARSTRRRRRPSGTRDVSTDHLLKAYDSAHPLAKTRSKAGSLIQQGRDLMIATRRPGDHKVQAALLGGVSVRDRVSVTASSRRRPPMQPYMHAKMMIADSARAYIGSMNFSTHSLTLAREVGAHVLRIERPSPGSRPSSRTTGGSRSRRRQPPPSRARRRTTVIEP